MNSGALELDGLLLSNSHVVHRRYGETVLRLAGKLRSGDGAVIDLVNAVWNRRLHDDVGISGSNEGSRCQKCCSERHGNVGDDSAEIVQRQT
jgi:hypothetical protein